MTAGSKLLRAASAFALSSTILGTTVGVQLVMVSQAQAAMVSPGLEAGPKDGYCDSTSHNTLAAKPASFTPSVVATP